MKRNPSVEFFRCALMFLITLWHCYDCGPLSRVSGEGLWSVFFALTFWHVDGFVAISGWYGIRFRWSKVIRLWGIMTFYSAIRIGCQYWSTGHVGLSDLSVSGGWFGDSYMMLMFVAPLVNVAVDCAAAKSRWCLLEVWLLFVAGMTLSWLPLTAALSGCNPVGGGGWSFLTIFFVYTTARVLKVLGFHWSRRVGLFAAMGLFCGVAVLGGATWWYRAAKGMVNYGSIMMNWTTYNAPHLWFFAIALLAMFEQRVKTDWLGRVSVFLAPSMFSVFLLSHTCGLAGRLYIEPEHIMAERWGCHPALIILMAAVGVFVMAIVVDLMRRMVATVLLRGLKPLFDAIDAAWERMLIKVP